MPQSTPERHCVSLWRPPNAQCCHWKGLRYPRLGDAVTTLPTKGLCVTSEGFLLKITLSLKRLRCPYCCLPLRYPWADLYLLCILDLGIRWSPWSKFPSLQVKHFWVFLANPTLESQLRFSALPLCVFTNDPKPFLYTFLIDKSTAMIRSWING